MGSGTNADFTDTEILDDLKALKDLGIIHAYPVLLAGYRRFNSKLPDFKKLINKILKKKKKKYLILINLNEEKSNNIKKYLRVLNKIEISSKRNIYFCSKK